MTQVNDFGAFALQDPAHDVDGCIMTIKKRGCRDETNFLLHWITHIATFESGKVRPKRAGNVGAHRVGKAFNETGCR
jgi:hypothetical protein